MKNENLWSIFSFFMTQNQNETNQEIKKNNQSRYNRFPRNLLSFASLNQSRFFSSVSVAMEEDYIILEWRVERQVKKNWADVFHVFSQGIYVTTMEELENTAKTPKMFSVKASYWNLSWTTTSVSDRDHFFGWQFENFLF